MWRVLVLETLTAENECTFAECSEPEVLRKLCQRIPYDTDVLLTHAPPRGFLDEVTVTETTTNRDSGQKQTSRRKVHCGELELLRRQLVLKAEAEATAAAAMRDARETKRGVAPAVWTPELLPERWPCCCHIFGHVSPASPLQVSTLSFG